MVNRKIDKLEQKLSSYNFEERMAALSQLQNLFTLNHEEQENVNMHFHSFHSYNFEFWSPVRIAWEAKKRAFYAVGIIDFDVLSGLEEFFEASEKLGLRVSVGIETRAFLKEYANKELDSPGEPGVSYIAGTGFYKLPDKKSPQSLTLDSYSKKSAARNIALIERINHHVPRIAVTYDEVLSLTPSGNATERHIISAYIHNASEVHLEKSALLSYWSELLNLGLGKTDELIRAGHKFEDMVRTKFAKQGGFGYIQPSADTFPPVEDFFDFVKSCGAMPMESWLDGTSEGEKDGLALLELSKSKGAAALNLIPDRNWNIVDCKEKVIKIQNLKNIIEAAVKINMPIHIGTEMNKKGLPLVDDLNGADLKPYKEIFLEGARIIVGHTLLGRFADFCYLGEKAESELSSLEKRNAFFASVGALPPVNSKIAIALREAGIEKSFIIICDSAKRGNWII